MTAKANKLCKVCGEPVCRRWHKEKSPKKGRSVAYGYWVYGKTCGKSECVMAQQGKLDRRCPACGEPVKSERVKTKTKGYRWNYQTTCGREECKKAGRKKMAITPRMQEARRRGAVTQATKFYGELYANEIAEIGLDWVKALHRCIQAFESRASSRLDSQTQSAWDRLFKNMMAGVRIRDRRVRRTKPRPAKAKCSGWDVGLRRAIATLMTRSEKRSVSAWERKFDTARSNWNRKSATKR